MATATVSWYPLPGAISIESKGSVLNSTPDAIPRSIAPVGISTARPAVSMSNAKSNPAPRSVRTVKVPASVIARAECCSSGVPVAAQSETRESTVFSKPGSGRP